MESEQTNSVAPPQRRQICCDCHRPLSVCLCHAIPASQIPTTTQIIVIQHPHEARHKLTTTPLLTKSLLNATSVVARRVTDSLHPLLTERHHSPNTFYLFPPTHSSPAVTISDLKKSLNPHTTETAPLVLIVFDATWMHAKEMVSSSEGHLSKIAARRVCLDGFDSRMDGGSMYDSDLVLRKEPCGGCVSTAEAVARWLGKMEGNGPEIEGKLIGLLREMVRLQAQFLKPMKPRPKLVKKSKLKQMRNREE